MLSHVQNNQKLHHEVQYDELLSQTYPHSIIGMFQDKDVKFQIGSFKSSNVHFLMDLILVHCIISSHML